MYTLINGPYFERANLAPIQRFWDDVKRNFDLLRRNPHLGYLIEDTAVHILSLNTFPSYTLYYEVKEPARVVKLLTVVEDAT
jgi:plasmid stabilization system protein ParE